MSSPIFEPPDRRLSQVLTTEQMRSAEQTLFDSGTSVGELMERAAGGAAEWVRRIAAGRPVTVLCGPGNNGGDGYVIARILRAAGHDLQVIAPLDPSSEAAREARDAWGGPVAESGEGASGDILVDALFGYGLSRPLTYEHAGLVRALAGNHRQLVAIDLPSGIVADSGEALNDGLPPCDVTLALGAWKFAHWSGPSSTAMGRMELVDIGIGAVPEAAHLATRPHIAPPERNAHKYTRGLVAVIGGAMPGAGVLASEAAMRAGAGYVKLFADHSHPDAPADLVVDDAPLDETLGDERISAVLIGSGLGRDDAGKAALASALQHAPALVLDADALALLGRETLPEGKPILATPHDGELATLCDTFGVTASDRRARVIALAEASGMTILAKGPDSVVAVPDGRLAIGLPAPSWLSVAGTGDVLAGIAVSRMATGAEPFAAACEALWLHGEAARRCGAAFTAHELALQVASALAACVDAQPASPGSR